MKKIISLVLAIVLVLAVFVTPVMASEVCELSDGTECEIWWMYNKTEHWRACVNHRDQKGNDAPITEREPHTFEDGICTICEAKEVKGVGMYSYLFVFIVVLAVSLLIPMKMQRSFKKNKFDEHPFGLDKYRKF